MDRSKLLICLFLFLCLNISLLRNTKVTYVEKVQRRVLFLNSSLYNFEKKKCPWGRENIHSEINIT